MGSSVFAIAFFRLPRVLGSKKEIGVPVTQTDLSALNHSFPRPTTPTQELFAHKGGGAPKWWPFGTFALESVRKLKASTHCAWSDHFVVGIPGLGEGMVAVLPLVGIRICQYALLKLLGSFLDILDKRYRLNSHDIEAFSAPDILAAHRIIASDHVALRFGKTSPVAVVGSARQLRFFPPHDPLDLILSLLPAVRTSHHMRTLFRPLFKKISFFHAAPRWLAPNYFGTGPPLQSCPTAPLAGKSDA
jgi:hypothetical protein